MYHVVIYWQDGLTVYVGTFVTSKEACECAMSYKQISDAGKITMAKF